MNGRTVLDHHVESIRANETAHQYVARVLHEAGRTNIGVHEVHTEQSVKDAALAYLRAMHCQMWPACGWIISSDRSDEQMQPAVEWIFEMYRAISETLKERGDG